MTGPVLRRASGEIERLQTGGVPLGLLRNAPYDWGQVTLELGDILLIFTDGLVEAEDSKEKEYGESQMLATLNSAWGQRSDGDLTQSDAVADQFVGSTLQHDDIAR